MQMCTGFAKSNAELHTQHGQNGGWTRFICMTFWSVSWRSIPITVAMSSLDGPCDTSRCLTSLDSERS